MVVGWLENTSRWVFYKAAGGHMHPTSATQEEDTDRIQAVHRFYEENEAHDRRLSAVQHFEATAGLYLTECGGRLHEASRGSGENRQRGVESQRGKN